jgi:hypothetical protein
MGPSRSLPCLTQRSRRAVSDLPRFAVEEFSQLDGPDRGLIVVVGSAPASRPPPHRLELP